MKQKWVWKIFFFVFFFLAFGQIQEKAAQTTEKENLIEQQMEENRQIRELQKEIDDILGNEVEISVVDIVKKLIHGDLEEVEDLCGSLLIEIFLSEIENNRKIFIQIMIITILAAMFSNFSGSFMNQHIEKTSNFTANLAVALLIITSYGIMSKMTIDAIQNMIDFIKALIPAYSMAVTVTAGAATSVLTYELFLMMAGVCQWFVLKGAIPLIHVRLLLGIINHLGGDNQFEKMEELLSDGIGKFLKIMCTFLLGINFIRSMIAPAADSFKTTVLQKGMQSLPFAGSILSTITGSVIGAGVMIKNAVGAIGLIVIIFILLSPVIKVMIMVLGYKLCEAVLQPIGGEEVLAMIDTGAETGKLLLQAMISCGALFFLAIAMTAMLTNMRYYAG